MAYIYENIPVDARIAYANSSRASVDALWNMTDDPSDLVKIAVVDNSCTNQRSLHKLSHDPNDEVRYEVAKSPWAFVETILGLTRDDNTDVSRAAYENLKQRNYSFAS